MNDPWLRVFAVVLCFPRWPKASSVWNASSITICPLDPPKPNELTETRRKPGVGHGVHTVGILRIPSKFPLRRRRSTERNTYLEVVLLSVDLWIKFLEKRIRGDNTLLENEDTFENASEAADTLGMAYIGLDGASDIIVRYLMFALEILLLELACREDP